MKCRLRRGEKFLLDSRREKMTEGGRKSAIGEVLLLGGLRVLHVFTPSCSCSGSSCSLTAGGINSHGGGPSYGWLFILALEYIFRWLLYPFGSIVETHKDMRILSNKPFAKLFHSIVTSYSKETRRKTLNCKYGSAPVVSTEGTN